MHYFYVLIRLGLVLWPMLSLAKEPLTLTGGRAIHPELFFEQFTNRNGLPDDRIRTFYQDSHGYLWIGTMNGLSRYDGYSFRNFYRTPQANSIPGNWTYTLCEDHQQTLWIGTREGLSQFDPRTESFTNYRHNPADATSLLCNQINSLVFDTSGKLWIGTPKGVTVFDPHKRMFTRLKQYPLTTAIGKIIRSTGDYLWIATAEGLVRYQTTMGHYEFFRLTVRPNAYGDRFWTLLEDNRQVFIGTGADGLIQLVYDANQHQYRGFRSLNRSAVPGQSLAKTEVFDICKAGLGSYWLGTSQGLVRYDQPGTSKARIFQYRHNPINGKSISNNRVYSLLIDRNQVLWSGTEAGLNKLDLRLLSFQYYAFASQQTADQIRSILATGDGTVWLGTARSGLYRYNQLTNITQHIQFGAESSYLNYHRAMFKDSRGDLWLGTIGGAVQLKAGAFNQPIRRLDGAAVFAFMEDSDKNIWLGTNKGLYKLDANGSTTHYPLRPPKGKITDSEFVRALHQDHTGGIWVGYENNGLFRLEPKTGLFSTVEGIRPADQLVGTTVYAILETPQHTLWVGTESGLTRLEVRSVTNTTIRVHGKTYQKKEGLPDQSVNGILIDRQQRLWLSTIKGIVHFNPNREEFQVYLPMLTFTHTCLYQADGNMLFGASDGFVVVNPGAITVDTHVPKVMLSDLKIFNKEVNIGEVINGDTLLRQALTSTHEITFNHQNNGFTLGFTGLHFSNPDENQYAYRLLGFDRGWITTSARNRTATYTNLNPGTYQFQVRAANSAKRWNPTPNTITITILPPPWKTWWAIALYILAFNGLLVVFIRYILIEYRQRQQLRMEQAEKEQLRTLNQLKLQFFTDISHEFRTPLTLITAPTEDLLASSDIRGKARQKLQFIQHNCQKLLSLLDELMTFQKLEQGMVKLRPERLDLITFVRGLYENFIPMADKKDITFHLRSDLASLSLSIDPARMEKVLNNLMANALRFTPSGGTIGIRLSLDTPVHSAERNALGWVCIAVKDTGKGIPPKELPHLFERFFQSETSQGGSGVGLSLTKSLVELHQGVITAESEPGVLTTFRVYLPLTEADAEVEQAPANDLDLSDLSAWSAPVKPINDLFESVSSIISDAQQPNILLVDDNPEVLAYLDLLFQDAYQITLAENGRQALEAVRHQEPDLIISDVVMPDMDGVQLCQIMKTDLTTCHIPLILLTARSTVEHQIEGFGTGADDYIAKPFHADLLRVRVANLLTAQQRLREKFRASPFIVPKDIARNPLDEAFFKKVVGIIKANLGDDDFNVEELGRQVNMSRSNLFRKVKAITGQTTIEFIYHIRLKHAMELLLERKLTVAEIAYKVGFKSPSSFSKSFRKQFGKAPTDYLSDLLLTQQP